MIRPACQKKCAHLCDEMLEKNENQFLNGRVGKVSGAKHQKTNCVSICLTKSIGIPYQSLGELTHTPALTKPNEIECNELWTASTDRSSTSLQDTGPGPCQTKPDLTESLRAVGKDNKVRANLLPLEALHGEIVIPNKRNAAIYIYIYIYILESQGRAGARPSILLFLPIQVI